MTRRCVRQGWHQITTTIRNPNIRTDTIKQAAHHLHSTQQRTCTRCSLRFPRRCCEAKQGRQKSSSQSMHVTSADWSSHSTHRTMLPLPAAPCPCGCAGGCGGGAGALVLLVLLAVAAAAPPRSGAPSRKLSVLVSEFCSGSPESFMACWPRPLPLLLACIAAACCSARGCVLFTGDVDRASGR